MISSLMARIADDRRFRADLDRLLQGLVLSFRSRKTIHTASPNMIKYHRGQPCSSDRCMFHYFWLWNHRQFW